MSRDPTVLILSNDRMLAALLGMYAELADLAPVFAARGERPEDALDRTHPSFAFLMDGEMEEVRSDLFFVTAAKHRVGLAIVTRPGAVLILAAEAHRRGVPSFPMPADLGAFSKIIEAAHASEWWRGNEDRRADTPDALATYDAGGTLVFVDRGGRQWRVYDRRGGQRRAQLRSEGEAGAGESSRERLFVGDDGDTLRCVLDSGEEERRDAESLERQLGRATRT